MFPSGNIVERPAFVKCIYPTYGRSWASANVPVREYSAASRSNPTPMYPIGDIARPEGASGAGMAATGVRKHILNQKSSPSGSADIANRAPGDRYVQSTRRNSVGQRRGSIVRLHRLPPPRKLDLRPSRSHGGLSRRRDDPKPTLANVGMAVLEAFLRRAAVGPGTRAP